MDRNEYLHLAQRYCAARNSCNAIPNDLIVLYSIDGFNQLKYYPVGYELSFDDSGEPIHTAILKDTKANSLVRAILERVEKYE